MAIQIQLRQGTTTEHNTFTGAVGEVTVDTDKKTVVVHDGVTAGGTVLAKVSEVPSLVPQATEAVAGKAKIATTAIAQAGTNNTDIITAKKLRDALNATGDLPIACFRSYGYVKTSGTTVTLAKQLNVASVVRVSTGTYTVTFSTPMPDTNYLILLGMEGNAGQDFVKISPQESKTANGFNITLFASSGSVDGGNFSFGVIT